MSNKCETCDGEGVVECTDCDGKGFHRTPEERAAYIEYLKKQLKELNEQIIKDGAK